VHDQFEPGLDEIERHRPAHIAKPDKTKVSVIGFLLVTAAIVARGGYRETALAQMSVKA
jgi:hypothetical protein